MTLATSDRIAWHNWRLIRIVFSKEIVDHARDWRSLLLALMYPLLGPLLVGLLLALSTGAVETETREPPIRLVVAGGEHDPGLTGFLYDQDRLYIEPPIDDLEMAVRSGLVPLALVIPAEAATEPFYTARILVDGSQALNRVSAAGLTELVHAYARIQSAALVEQAGLDSALLEPVRTVQVDIGERESAASILFGMIGPFTIFIVFLGSVYVSIDSIAGERERGSLEPLLTTPVDRWVLLAGKAGAAMAFTALSTAVSLAAFKLIADGVAADIHPPPPSLMVYGALFALALPLMTLAVTLQMLIAVLSRSMKEAQVYLGLLPLIPAMPGILLVFAPVQLGLWSSGVPVLGHLVLMSEILAGHAVPPLMVSLAVMSTVIPALLLFLLATFLFRREAAFHNA